MKTLAELEVDDELDLNELDLESSGESQSISSTETPNEQTNERKRNVFIIHEFKINGPVPNFASSSSISFKMTQNFRPSRTIFRTNGVIGSQFSSQHD